MASKNAFLQLSRSIHLYFGLLISPALLFFAFTGGYQTLGFHEASSDYKAPALLASLAQLHKKQTYVVPVRRPGPDAERSHGPAASGTAPVASAAPAGTIPASPSEAGASKNSQSDRRATVAGSSASTAMSAPAARAPLTLAAKQKQHLPLKLFFVLVSLGLFTSTLTGIYMAYRYERNKLLVTGLLVTGVVLPLVLTQF